MILKLILAVLFVEAVTEIIVASEITGPLREKLWEISGWLGKLVNCGYCTSVWVAASVGWIFELGTPSAFIDFAIATFVVHRLSNLWHEFAVRWLNRAPLTFHLMKTERVEVEYEQQQSVFAEDSGQEIHNQVSTEDQDSELFTTEKTGRISKE